MLGGPGGVVEEDAAAYDAAGRGSGWVRRVR